eukprot:CCRYP_019429-RA/>CCRYP_019429-RA protein AED:0.41 eAED:0.41 QI:0/0/0/1/1/1/3/0/512
MGPSRSSPSPASLCTKTLACSSLAKANPSSSVPAALRAVPHPTHPTQGRWQPRRPSRKQDKHSDTPTAYHDLPSTEQAIRWMHAVCGYPVKSTWLKAVQAGNFIGWPLLTSRSVQKYFPETVETPKGHLNQCRKSVRSTKPKPIPLETFQSPQLVGRKLRDVYTHVYDTPDTIFSDQTGQFPHRSSSGNHYLMVMVDIDFGAILVEPIKNRTDLELTRAYSTLITRLHRAGVVPRKHVLDNEISTAMKTLITDTYKMTYELVPPGCHRRNAAEVAIRNFKSHFLSILAGVADDFPMKLWDKLLPQARLPSTYSDSPTPHQRFPPTAHLNGPFDYNKMPLAPMGCSVQVHEKSGAAAHGHSTPSAAGTSAHPLSITARIDATSSPPTAVSACAAALKGITAPTKDIADLKALLDITASTSNIADCVPSPTRHRPHQLPSRAAPLPKPNAANSRSTQLSLTQLLLATLVHTPQPKPNSLPPQQPAPAQRVSRIPKPIPILSKRMKRVDKEVHGP